MTAPDDAVSEGVTGDGHSAAEAVRRVFGGRRRSRVEGGRPHKFTVRFTDQELQAVTLKATAARVAISRRRPAPRCPPEPAPATTPEREP